MFPLPYRVALFLAALAVVAALGLPPVAPPGAHGAAPAGTGALDALGELEAALAWMSQVVVEKPRFEDTDFEALQERLGTPRLLFYKYRDTLVEEGGERAAPVVAETELWIARLEGALNARDAGLVQRAADEARRRVQTLRAWLTGEPPASPAGIVEELIRRARTLGKEAAAGAWDRARRSLQGFRSLLERRREMLLAKGDRAVEEAVLAVERLAEPLADALETKSGAAAQIVTLIEEKLAELQRLLGKER